MNIKKGAIQYVEELVGDKDVGWHVRHWPDKPIATWSTPTASVINSSSPWTLLLDGSNGANNVVVTDCFLEQDYPDLDVNDSIPETITYGQTTVE
jgi:hypothetical protein